MAYSTNDLNQIHDLAHRQAELLRREAMTDFWRGADAVLQSAGHTAYRSAQRLAYRLARRARKHANGSDINTPNCPAGSSAGCQ